MCTNRKTMIKGKKICRTILEVGQGIIFSTICIATWDLIRICKFGGNWKMAKVIRAAFEIVAWCITPVAQTR